MDEVRDRNVYILGAGFSAPAGVPVIHDFIDRSRIYFDDPSSSMDKTEREHFKRFLEFKRKMSQAREKVTIDLDNIEELFGLVEISQRLGHESIETRTSTVYVIAKTLELATRSQRVGEIDFRANEEILKKRGKPPEGFYKPDGFSEEVLAADPYLYFASLASGLLDDPNRQTSRANTFITFNYDLLLDDALRKVGIAPDYRLPKQNTVVEDQESQPTTTCSVLKLHGSTNWGICASCQARVVVLTEKATASAAQFRARACPNCRQSEFQPMLIPPSWDKSEYRELMKPIWSKAVEELKLASRICIIGYSMPPTDSFFKYLITLALAENHNLYRFIVVDKNPNIAARYKNLLEPVFRERRFFPFDDQVGFVSFLSDGRSCAELGRGELVWGNLSRR
jgi:NAD-dependent SIR2 family protein deacetylase